MKLEKAVSGAWSALLSFFLSFASIGCIVTGFDMGVELHTAALCCAVAAVVCSICFTLPLGLIPPCVAAVIGGYLWQSGSLEMSLEALLNRLTRQYDKAYGWGIIRWGVRTADDMEPTMILILCVIGVFIAMAIAWAVCRRKPAASGIFLSILPLAACLVVTDTVPDTLWLYLLLLGIIILLLTNTVRRQDEKQGNRVCALVSLPAAVLLLVLFAAVPQASYTGQANAQSLADAITSAAPLQALLERFTESGITGTVDSSTVDLSAVGVRLESEAKIMEVTADFDGELYLRGRTLDHYDGEHWSSSGVDTSALGWPADGLDAAGEVSISTRYAHRMLYTPYYTGSLNLQYKAGGLVNEKKLTQYSFSCNAVPDASYFTGLYLTQNSWAGEGWTPELLLSFITLEKDVEKWAQPLAEAITGNVTSPYHRAQAIADYVRKSAGYDLDTGRMPASEDEFVRWFLQDSNTGYCIHFASAATVLLQASGIPARYVTGYVAEVTAGETTVVKASQAHAWAESWLPGFGWTVLEATPADLSEEPAQTQQTTEPTQTTGTQDSAEITAPTIPDASSKTEQRGEILTAVLWIAAILALIAFAEGQRVLRRWLRQRRRSRGSVNEQAVLRWQETVQLARLLSEEPDKAVFTLAQKAKFSLHVMTGEELGQFDSYIRGAQERLRKRSVFHRFVYRIILAVY